MSANEFLIHVVYKLNQVGSPVFSALAYTILCPFLISLISASDKQKWPTLFFCLQKKSKVHVAEQQLLFPDSKERAVVLLVQSFAKPIPAFASHSPWLWALPAALSLLLVFACHQPGLDKTEEKDWLQIEELITGKVDVGAAILPASAPWCSGDSCSHS